MIAIVFIIYNPYIIFSASFNLSFLASLSIILFNPIFFSYVENLIKKYKLLNKKVIIYIMKNITLFLAVQVSIIPMQLMYFNKLSIISLFSNIFILPIVSVELILSILYIPFNNIKLIILLNEYFLKILFYLTEKVSSISKEIYLASPTMICIILYYLLVLMIIYEGKILFKIFKSKKKLYMISKIVIIIYIIAEILYRNYFISFTYHFYVGQGNMSIIKNKGTTVVYDCGSVTDTRVYRYLIYVANTLNIREIDAIAISHFHEDHINALEEILKNIKVRYIIYEQPKNDKNINKYKQLIEKYNVKEINVYGRDIVKIGDVTIDIYSSEELVKSTDILNSNCLITLISYSNKYHLFMGDSTKETEEKFLEEIKEFKDSFSYMNKLNNLDSFVVGHHGSRTSTTENLLKVINYNVAIISSEKYKFKHPNEEVIEKLKTEKKKLFIMTYEKKGLLIR